MGAHMTTSVQFVHGTVCDGYNNKVVSMSPFDVVDNM